MIKSVSMVLNNVIDKKDAEPIVKMLQGKTYMELDVTVCPVGGSFDIVVSTSYEEPLDSYLEEIEDIGGGKTDEEKEEMRRVAVRNEMRELVLGVMSFEIMKGAK
jgi:hypothetical protein